MANEMKVPGLGENITSGTVVKVLVAEGDAIEVDQPILELETGKATIELPSEVSGKITKINVKDGDEVNVGDVLLTVEGDGGGGAEPAKEDKKQEPAKEKKEEKAEEPEKTEKEEPEKKTEEPASPRDAEASEDEEEDDKEEEKTPRVPERSKIAQKQVDEQVKISADSHVPVPAGPSVRKFAREIGIQITEVSGTGERGRITIDDVKAYAKRALSSGGGGTGGVRVPPLPDFSEYGDVKREPMNNIRKMTAQHMTLCWSAIPHVTQHDTADITDLENMRKRYSKHAEKAGAKLTLTAMLLKITASALKVFPQFNASIDTQNNQIIYKKYYNIGVAVDTAKGLLVPIVRDVDQKNIIELSIELNEIAEKARRARITPADMQGGTFTISNLGGIGGSFFTPIVNWPDVAILGIGRGSIQPVHIDGEFKPRLILPLSLSYDHRLIDGADGARFLKWIADAINEPLLLAMEG